MENTHTNISELGEFGFIKRLQDKIKLTNKDIIKGIGDDAAVVDFGNKKKELSYLSEIEKQIRDIVVFKKTKIVEIAFENKNIQPIIITEQHKTREQLARYILEHKIAKGAKLLIEIRAQGNYKLTLIKN